MQLKDLRALVATDLAAVDAEIRRQLGSDVALVNQVAHHIIHNGGKRLRPLAVLLAARACGAGRSQDHIAAAAIWSWLRPASQARAASSTASGRRRLPPLWMM